MKKKILSARIEKVIYEFDEYDIKTALMRIYEFPVGWTQSWEFSDCEDASVLVKLVLSRTNDVEEKQETI